MLDLRRALGTFLLLGGLGLLALAAPGTVGAFGEIWEAVDQHSPYFPGADPVLTWVRFPVVVAGTFALVMGPGLLLALALGLATTVSRWTLNGFVLSLGSVSVTSTLVQEVLGRPLTGTGFVVTVLALDGLALAAVVLRVARGRPVAWPLEAAGSWIHALALFAVPAAMASALAPKVFWEDFNGDGIHGFEAARLLLHQPVPFWRDGSGDLALFPGVADCLFTWPTSWFLRVFGENEAAVRLPYFFFLALLNAAIVDISERAGTPRLGGRAHGLVWLGLASFALVLGYSATYTPYCADLALPAATDMLFMVCAIATFAAFFDGSLRRLFVWTLLTTLASAGAAPLLLALVPASIIACRERPWRRLAWFLLFFVMAAAAARVLPAVLRAGGLPVPGGEHDLKNMLPRFKYLWFLDLKRWLWIMVPAGIYPLAVVGQIRKADDGTRTLLLVAAIVFAFYYAMAFVSLHYFVPAMLLPLAAFWRHERVSSWRRPATGATACLFLALVAVGLGLPQRATIFRGAREVGRAIDTSSLPGYETMQPEYFRGIEILEEVVPKDFSPEVPDRGLGCAPQVSNFYATRSGGPPAKSRAVVVARAGTPPPDGLVAQATRGGASLYVRDPATVERLRRMKPEGSQGRWLYSVPPDILFMRVEEALKRPGMIAVKRVLERLGYRGG